MPYMALCQVGRPDPKYSRCPALPGCHSQGNTLEDAIENIKDAIETYLQMITEETKDATVYEVEVST